MFVTRPLTDTLFAGRTKLCLGSGNKKAADAVNIDMVAETGPDICHDLNQMPWPLPENSFEECHAYDVVEHLGDIVALMSRHGATVRITVPLRRDDTVLFVGLLLPHKGVDDLIEGVLQDLTDELICSV